MSLDNDDPQIGTSNEKVPLNLATNPKWSLITNLENNNKIYSNNSNNNNNNNINHQMNKLNGNSNNIITNNNNNCILSSNNNNNNNNNNSNHNNNNRIMLKENNHKWAPLPQDEQSNNHHPSNNSISISEIMDDSKIPENNNEWKNGWKDMPQNGNNNNSTTLGNGNSNGHSDKLAEQDPLTGQQRLTDLDELSSCGIGSCRPKWARCFATTHVFMVVFLLAWVLQGMYYTYFVSVITTIEKLFQIKSKITGMLMSATEIGQISTSLFLTYYAGRGHRPRWIACGMILFAIASFGCTLPHFIYGDELLHANNVIQRQSAGFLTIGNATSLIEGNMNLCLVGNNASDSTCLDSVKEEQSNHTKITNIVLIIFAISLLGVGVGQTAVSTLGIPYIDDNVASRESPIYIAITIGVRILGPAFGFILGSFCTRIYVDFSAHTTISPTDPGWVGAWWLGLVLVSSLMGVTSIAMFTFPRHLRGHRIPPPAKLRAIEDEKKKSEKEEEPKAPKLKDFPKTIKRQLRNDILMFRTASSVLHLLPVAGLYTFLPKYMETQFRLPAHDANLISGIGGILVMGVGIVISGFVILKFSPTARSVAAWIAFAALIYSCGMAVLMFIGCPMDDFQGLKLDNPAPLPKFEPICNTTCDCDIGKFSPICGSDGMTYFSSCHAGCSESIKENGKLVFKNCQCIPDSLEQIKSQTASSGYCDGNCKKFIVFISVFSFLVFVHSTSEVGSMLLIMRCTDPKDKAMAMGVIQFAIGLFGNVPCPIIYGAVVDSACLVWETVCGKQGACSLYDGDVFRHFFLGTTSGIMFLAFIVDLVVWHKAHRIDIDPEANSENDYEKTTIVPDTNV